MLYEAFFGIEAATVYKFRLKIKIESFEGIYIVLSRASKVTLTIFGMWKKKF